MAIAHQTDKWRSGTLRPPPMATPPMRAISIRQPWASLIVLGYKDIENRTWPTKVRGDALVHAAKGMTRDEYDDAMEFAMSIMSPRHFDWERVGELGLDFDKIPRGGIIGQVNIVDCVTSSESRWFVGRFGFVLRDAKELPFRPLKGALGFFEVASVTA